MDIVTLALAAMSAINNWNEGWPKELARKVTFTSDTLSTQENIELS